MSSNTNPDLKGLEFPSDHQYVIIDTTTDLPEYKGMNRIPMMFWIKYSQVDLAKTEPPPLTLLINPNNMNLTFAKKISSNFARGGYVVEEWGEEQDVIVCEGKIGGYFMKKSSVSKVSPHALNGLNRYERSKSLSFKNLYKLLYIYRNNGAIFQNTVKDKKENKLIQRSGYPYINKRVPLVLENPKNRIDRLGDVFLGYDQTIYTGAFDSFSITEDANSPYTLSYKFQFTVQRRVVTDYRDFEFHMASATENSEVKRNSEKVRRVVENAIAIQKEAVAAEITNLDNRVELGHALDSPVTKESLSSGKTPTQSTRETSEVMRKNGVILNEPETAEVKEGFETVAIAEETKIYGLSQIGKDKVRRTLYESAIRNGKDTQKAASLANNVMHNSVNDAIAPAPQNVLAGINTGNGGGDV